ncbi:hypothetical protein JCM14469_41880 [Desulfatiferula olefinivorans]
MNRIYILILRVILSAACAVMLTRLFHPEKSLVFTVGLAALLLSLSYVSAYFRSKHANTKEKGR